MSYLDRLKAKLAEQENAGVRPRQQPPEPSKYPSDGFGGEGAARSLKHKASETPVAMPRLATERKGAQLQSAFVETQAISAWRAGIAQLDLEQIPCFGFRSGEEWAATSRNMVWFLDEYGAEAVRCGWSTLDLFGIAPGLGPYFASELCGALVVPWHGRALAVTRERITFERLLYNKRPLPGTAAIWDCDVWGLLDTPEGRRERTRAIRLTEEQIARIEATPYETPKGGPINLARNLSILG